MDVLGSLASEYLQNLGRTLKFYCDKYGNSMTGEVCEVASFVVANFKQEIVLHSLFESGVPQVSDLERYIKEDIVRYGARMTDLEKKLRNAYTEAVCAFPSCIRSIPHFSVDC